MSANFCWFWVSKKFSTKTQHRIGEDVRLCAKLFVDIFVQQSTRLPRALIPVHLSVRAEQFFLLQTADLILHGGKYLLDLSNIHVLKDTLELISFMILVHWGPHAVIHEYSPNRPVDREMEHSVFRNHLIFWRKIPDNFLLKYPTRLQSEMYFSAKSLPTYGAPGPARLTCSLASTCITWDWRMSSPLKTDAPGLPRLQGSELWEQAPGLPGLHSTETEFDCEGDPCRCNDNQIARKSRLCNHEIGLFSLCFFLHLSLRHGWALINSNT